MAYNVEDLCEKNKDSLWAHSGLILVKFWAHSHFGRTLVSLGSHSGHTRVTVDPTLVTLGSHTSRCTFLFLIDTLWWQDALAVDLIHLITRSHTQGTQAAGTLRWQDASGVGSTVERTWNKYASQGQILASA